MLALLAGCALPAASPDVDGGDTSTGGSQTSGAATSTSTGSAATTDAAPATRGGGAGTSSSGAGASVGTSGPAGASTGAGSEAGATTSAVGSTGEASTGDGPDVPLETVFESFTEASGVHMPHDCVYEAQYPPGIGIRDFDGDGHQDLFLTNWEGPSQLWLGEGGGSFSEAALGSVLAEHASTGVAVGDYDNDGWPDVFVPGTGSGALLQGSAGGLMDGTGSTGIVSSVEGTVGAWADFDGDGDLDLFAGAWNAETMQGSQELFRNDGDGTFTDLSMVFDAVPAGRPVLAASFVDYDNDGDADLYVVIDKSHGNVLWRNDGPGCGGWCFIDVAQEAGADLSVHGMGLAVGDYDNDGDLDLYVTDISAAFLLENQSSQGEAIFLDVTEAAGVDLLGVGWGAVFADYDNDGWQDLYVAQGTYSGGALSANVLFHNLGDGTFDALGSASGAVDQEFSQAVAFGDLDEDGFLDLVVGNRQHAYAVYRNRAEFGAGNNWVEIELRGVAPVSADAAGARASLTTDDGLTQLREVKLGSSMASTNMLPMHFGLAAHDGAELSVLWPNGETAAFVLESSDLNQRLVITYPGTILPE